MVKQAEKNNVTVLRWTFVVVFLGVCVCVCVFLLTSFFPPNLLTRTTLETPKQNSFNPMMHV